MTKIKLMIEIAKYVVFVLLALRDLVIQAEENMPESGKGKIKFEAVKEALLIAAKYAGIGADAIEAIDDFVSEKINAIVAKEINGQD
jgi:hypothetical protein